MGPWPFVPERPPLRALSAPYVAEMAFTHKVYEMKLEEITLIVPTKNEEKNIGKFLYSLPPNVWLTVVDASDDLTVARILKLRPERTTIIREPCNVSMARQWGAERAHTRWLLFSDADVVFPRGYFERLSALVEDDVIYGPKLSNDQFKHYYRCFAYGQAFFHRLRIPSASGSNLLIRRTAWAHVGGFDTRLPCNEDSEIVWRIRKAGFCVTFDRELVVYATDHRRLYRGIWRKTAHSLFCCAVLRFNLLPRRWRGYDFGYWSVPQPEEHKASH